MKIAFIGCGNMGEGILSGLTQRKSSDEMIVCEPRPDRREYLKAKYGVTFVETPGQAAAVADVVLLSVKPQDLPAVLSGIKDGSPLFLSIAAGITTAFIEKALGGKARVVRAMPNLPAMIGEGMAALTAGRYVRPGDLDTACKILEAAGAALVVDESMIDAVTAVSGSGPAYVFLFAECLLKAAKDLGFDDGEAKTLVYQTLRGSVHMLANSSETPEALRVRVTSKGGTTQAATDVFLKRDIVAIYQEALRAAKARAGELSI